MWTNYALPTNFRNAYYFNNKHINNVFVCCWFSTYFKQKRKNQNKRRIKKHMSDAMTEINRGTYFKDRSKLKPKTKNNNKSNKKEKTKYDKKRIN
ncbi:hypothetical protein PSOLA_05030 [Candidatus Phytoplasma solani]